MFPADSLNPQYLEEQAAKYAAKQLAQKQMSAATSIATTTPMATRPATPANLTTQPRTGMLGNIFQGLVRASSYNHQEHGYKSATPSPGLEKSELEALIAEKKRDADICSMPTW